MPLEWGSQAGSQAGRVEWGTQENEAAGPGIVSASGLIAAGEQVTFATVLIGTITSATFNGAALTIDSTATDQVTVTFPNQATIALLVGTEGDLVLDDGTEAATQAFTLEIEPGLVSQDVTLVPDPGTTDSFIELIQNSVAFQNPTVATGDQIHYTPNSALTVDESTIVYVNPPQTITGTLRYLFDDNGTIVTRESTYTIGPLDDTADSFDFQDQSEAIASTLTLSNTITPTGFNTPLPISITSGAYSINGGAFTVSNGTFNPGDSVQLRSTSAGTYPGSVTAILDIGGTTADWIVVNLSSPPDDTPDVFTFTDVTLATPGQVYTSNEITIGGTNIDSSITITGGTYSVNDGAYVSTPGDVESGDRIRVRATAPASFGQNIDVTLTVGGVSDTYTIATIPVDADPTPPSFTAVQNADLSTQYVSNTQGISSINVPIDITVANGEYSINGGAFTSVPGTVEAGQSFRLRTTTSGSFSSDDSVTVTLNNTPYVWQIVTLAADITPNPVVFNNTTNQALTAPPVISNHVTISGMNTTALVTVDNGAEYSIDEGPYTSSPTLISNGQTLRLRSAVPSEFSTTLTINVTIGDLATQWSITTVAEDRTPNPPIVFTSLTEVARATQFVSNTVQVQGINTDLPFFLVTPGLEYRLSDDGPWLTLSGTLSFEDAQIQLRMTSSAEFGTETIGQVVIDNITYEWAVTTADEDLTPNTFQFTDLQDREFGSQQSSEVVTISGINNGVGVTVSNAEYSIDGGAFTSTPGTINNGQTFQLRGVVPSDFLQTLVVEYTVGTLTGQWRLATREAGEWPQFVDFTLMHQELRPDVMDAPVPTLNRAIRMAARSMCIDARVAEHKIPNLTLQENEFNYPLEVDENIEILAITKVTDYQGYELRHPQDYMRGLGNTLVLNSDNNRLLTRGPLEITVRSAPARTATQLVNIIVDEHFDTLRIGALAELFALPGKVWTDLGQANYYRTLFNQRLLNARSLKEGNMQNKTTNMGYGGL